MFSISTKSIRKAFGLDRILFVFLEGEEAKVRFTFKWPPRHVTWKEVQKGGRGRGVQGAQEASL